MARGLQRTLLIGYIDAQLNDKSYKGLLSGEPIFCDRSSNRRCNLLLLGVILVNSYCPCFAR